LYTDQSRANENREQSIRQLRREEEWVLREINHVRKQLYGTRDSEILASIRKESDSLHQQLSDIRARLRYLGVYGVSL